MKNKIHILLTLVVSGLVACLSTMRGPEPRIDRGVLTSEEAISSAAPDSAYASDFGGPRLAHATFVPLYWGGDAVSFSDQIDDFYQRVGATPFVLGLAEYSSASAKIGAACAQPGVDVLDPLGSTVSDDQVRAMILSQIGAQRVPAPDGEHVYMVHLPPGVQSTISGNGLPAGFALKSCRHYCAYHLAFSDSAGNPIYYSVIPDQTGGAACPRCAADPDLVANTTRRISHQVAVDITDPASDLFATLSPPTAVLNHDSFSEIADPPCETTTAITPAGAVSGWWSNRLGACVTGTELPQNAFNLIPSSPVVSMAVGGTTTVHVALTPALATGDPVPVHATVSAPAGLTANVIGSGDILSNGAVDVQVTATAAVSDVAVLIAASTEGQDPLSSQTRVFVSAR